MDGVCRVESRHGLIRVDLLNLLSITELNGLGMIKLTLDGNLYLLERKRDNRVDMIPGHFILMNEKMGDIIIMPTPGIAARQVVKFVKRPFECMFMARKVDHYPGRLF